MKILLKFVLEFHDPNKRQPSQGFTIIELLIVVIIIGILGAMSIPAMLSQAAKARQSEAKSFIGSINRAQQAYMVETLRFAESIERLNILAGGRTQHYSYSFEITSTQGSVKAFPLIDHSGKAYTGATTLFINEAALKTIICESPQLGTKATADQNKIPSWSSAETTLYCPPPMIRVFQ